MSYNPDDPSIRLMRKLSTREGFIDEVYTRLPTHRSMVDAYWEVEYEHMSFFDRPRHSGHESFKTQVSKARKEAGQHALIVAKGYQGRTSPVGIFAAMSILTRILGLGSTPSANPMKSAASAIPTHQALCFLGMSTKAGVGVTEEGSMALSAVYSCVRLIASSLATLDLHLHRVNGTQREIAQDHPIYQLVNSTPCEHMTAFDFWELIISDALLHGEGFALIERGERTGQPVQMHLLTADKMRKHTTKGQVTYQHQDMEDHIFPEDLLIIRCFRGKSPIKQHMEGIGLAMAAQEFASRYYGSGGNVGGVFSTDRSLTNEQYERLRQSWQQTHGGLGNAHEVAILEHGLKYEPMKVSMAGE